MKDETNPNPVAWSELKTVLDQHERFVLTSHVRPDCDALGSELGLAKLLESLGKRVRIVNPDPTPPRLTFVDPESRIEVLHRDVEPAELDHVDVIVVLDTSAWKQLGGMADVIRGSSALVVVVDHHVGDCELNAMFFKNDQAEATGCLIAELAEYLDAPVTPDIARSLFTAIATDTGWFRFPSTKSSTYRTAAQLIDFGARPHEIFRQLFERDSIGRAKLRGIVLSHIVVECGGRLAHTFLLAEDFARTGARRSETEDFINMALVIEGTEVAIMLVEQPDGAFKASFRSRGAVDCSRVAAVFGGGGHKAAAGATLDGTFSDVQARVLAKVRAAMKGEAGR